MKSVRVDGHALIVCDEPTGAQIRESAKRQAGLDGHGWVLMGRLANGSAEVVGYADKAGHAAFTFRPQTACMKNETTSSLLTRAAAALQASVDAGDGHYAHFDRTMSGGAGCPACRARSRANEIARQVLREFDQGSR